LILFLELVLIRLIGTEIRIFAYVPNLILLATFVGSGLGFLLKKNISLFHSALALVLVIVATSMRLFKSITELLSSISDSYIWYQGTQTLVGPIIAGLVLTVVLFLAVMYVFMPLGQFLARLFESSKNITVSYSINILFSLMGILTFYLFSYLSISPYISIMLSLFLITLLTQKEKRAYSAVSSLVLIPFLLMSLLSGDSLVWSPYQKLQLTDLPAIPHLPPGKMLEVNNVGYMGLLDLSKEYQEKMSEKLRAAGLDVNKLDGMEYRNQYDLPYKLKPGAKSVLLIGAGAGNDAAGALRLGVEKITAIEIDPKIIEFGKKHHPENPYADDKVTVINDDGRAFLQRTNEKYDVVIMGLTDSHTLNSNLTNIQLDNFLYTEESLKDVYNVLNEEGLLFLSFEVGREWIGSRLKGSITEAFGQEPLIFTTQADLPIFGFGGVYFVVSKDSSHLENLLSENEELAGFIENRKVDYKRPNKYLTDDWPYLYLEGAKIPRIHLIISAILILLFVAIFYASDTAKKFDLSAFFMGVGFLLYEFQNIGRTSLIFGNTWKTNVLIISSILVLILLANLLYLKVKVSLKVSFVLLILSFILQLLLPINSFVAIQESLKLTVVPVLLNAPLFFAGLIFIDLFQKTKERKSFYASNLLGSAVGGLLSYLSYVFGIESLIYLSLVFYIIVLCENMGVRKKTFLSFIGK